MILGAGASYDSAPSYPPEQVKNDYRPPLADELFNDRPNFRAYFREYPDCLPLITNLRHRPNNKTVEQALEEFSAEAGANPARHQQLMAIRYCLHVILRQVVADWFGIHHGVTNYVTLIDHIRQWRAMYRRAILVTFNYDVMIEDALRTLRIIDIRAIDDYVANAYYKLIKVHGSVNWARDIGEPAGLPLNQTVYIEQAEQIRVSDRWHVATDWPIRSVRYEDRDLPAVPAIALPLLYKAHFECSPKGDVPSPVEIRDAPSGSHCPMT